MDTTLLFASKVKPGTIIRYQNDPSLDEHVLAVEKVGKTVLLTVAYQKITQIDRYKYRDRLTVLPAKI